MTIATSRGGGHACKISDHFWPLFFGSQKVDKTGSAITCAPSNSRGLEDIRRGWRYTYTTSMSQVEQKHMSQMKDGLTGPAQQDLFLHAQSRFRAALTCIRKLQFKLITS